MQGSGFRLGPGLGKGFIRSIVSTAENALTAAGSKRLVEL